MSEKAPKKLTPEEAEKLLPPGDTVHTFRNSITGELVGADWPKSEILRRLKTHGVELSGDNARRIGHGLASRDDVGWLYIQTRSK